MSEVLYRLEQSILNEPDSFFMYKDDLLGWIELLEEKQPQLNESQQIVLDYLKSRSKGENSPFAVVQGFRGFNGVPSLEINSLISLSIAEESQVLEVFSRWVQEQEEE